MSRPNQQYRELGPIGFALSPLLQIGCALAVSTTGTAIGNDIMKQSNMHFADMPIQTSLNIVAVSMAIGTTALSLVMLLASLCFAPRKPVSRYCETMNNSLFIAGTTPVLSFLAPTIGAYLSGISFLYDALYVGTASALGTTALSLAIFMMLGMGKIVSSCHQSHYHPAHEPVEFVSHSTQASTSDTHAVQIHSPILVTSPTNPFSPRSLSRKHTYSTESIASNSPIRRTQKPAFPTATENAAVPSRFVLLPAPPARKKEESSPDHLHRSSRSRCHHRTLTH